MMQVGLQCQTTLCA